MARRPLRIIAALALWLAACASPAPSPPPKKSGGANSAHGYALLFGLLGQEKDVAKLLLIKREQDDFQALIEMIGEVSGEAYERLEELGEADPSLELTDTGLPAGELAAREAITDTRTKALLAASGEELELLLALAQNEALSYMIGLTEVLARAEPDPDRAAFVQKLWKDLTRVHGRLHAFLRARYVHPRNPR